MKTKILEIDGKEYTVSELKYKDVAELADLSKSDSAKKMMQISVGLTDEEYDNLSMSDGLELMKIANKLNNIDTENFPAPVQQ